MHAVTAYVTEPWEWKFTIRYIVFATNGKQTEVITTPRKLKIPDKIKAFFRERALVAITVATEFGASVQPLTNTAIETRIADGIVVRKALSMEVLLYDS